MIRLPKDYTFFKDVEWTTRALPSKHDTDTKYGIDCLYSDGVNLVGCDSRRLHALDLAQSDAGAMFPEGFYELVKKTKAEMIFDYKGNEKKFPDYKSILNGSGEQVPLSMDINSAITEVCRLTYGYFNHEFLKDALAIEDSFSMDIQEKEGQPLKLRNHTKQAVVMPMRL